LLRIIGFVLRIVVELRTIEIISQQRDFS